jgi:hypothetical protein
MLIRLHKQATTTPKVRAAIQNSDDAGTVLAERFGVTGPIGKFAHCSSLSGVHSQTFRWGQLVDANRDPSN